MKILLISGTPGTGKTTVAKKINELIEAKIVSLNELAISEKLTLKYDKERETHVVDFDKLIPYIKDLIEQYKKENSEILIIESHFSDIVPDNYIDYAFVLRCSPDKLYNRLEKRGYNKEKIKENVQTEILGNCANFLIQKQLKVPIYEIDTSILTIESIAKIILDLIANNIKEENYIIGKIDWLEILAKDDRINQFFD